MNDLEEFCRGVDIFVPALVLTIKRFYISVFPKIIPSVPLDVYLSSVIPPVLLTDSGLGYEIVQASLAARYMHVERLIKNDLQDSNKAPKSPNVNTTNSSKTKLVGKSPSPKVAVDLRHLENTCINFLRYGKCDLPVGHKTKAGAVLEHQHEQKLSGL
jgi:hypothetical protein